MGCDDGSAGVGILVEQRWIEKVLEVKRISERIIALRVMVGKRALNLICVYAPQVGREFEEKEEFYITMGKVIAAVDACEHLVVCGDLNGHVGTTTDGFEGVHGGCGFGS